MTISQRGGVLRRNAWLSRIGEGEPQGASAYLLRDTKRGGSGDFLLRGLEGNKVAAGLKGGCEAASAGGGQGGGGGGGAGVGGQGGGGGGGGPEGRGGGGEGGGGVVGGGGGGNVGG